jgi:hypothetical protein
MLTIITLQALAGIGSRLLLGWGLRTYCNLRLNIPEVLAVALLMLAGLPDWLKPFAFPLPFSFMLGVVLPDLLIRRAVA